jgi:hypothetical protein
MSKEYYTKSEVDKLLANLKEEILDAISKKTTTNGFEFEAWRHGRGGFYWCAKLLQKHLTDKNLIEEVSEEQFRKAFMSEEKNYVSDKKPLIEWIGQKNLCPYLLDQLNDFYFIERERLDKNSKYIFGIKNAAQLRVKYLGNINQLPSNYKIIDDIVNDLVRERKLQIEDEIYFENEILPGIKDH